jgi:acetyl esterase/lipase
MKTLFFSALGITLCCTSLLAQQDSVYLYPQGVPGAIYKNIEESVIVNPQDGVTVTGNIQKPVLYVHLPKNPNGTCVLICPGGGYYVLAMDHEGHNIAKWFTERGITAFVLKSRLPDDELMTHKSVRPIQDAQQAIRIIRKNVAKWNIDTHKLGVMGFSAGGHLASSVGTHFTMQYGEIVDTSLSVRPDFMILAYPMISYQPGIYPYGMPNRLLGDKPTKAELDAFSNELHVTPQTPPTFLILSADDFLSPSNSVAFFTALQKNKVPAELHIYEKGGHGYALSKKQRGHVENWDKELEGWLRDRKLL